MAVLKYRRDALRRGFGSISAACEVMLCCGSYRASITFSSFFLRREGWTHHATAIPIM